MILIMQLRHALPKNLGRGDLDRYRDFLMENGLYTEGNVRFVKEFTEEHGHPPFTREEFPCASAPKRH